MTTQSKKHHYVPQALLRHFSIDGAGRQIFVFDKERNRVFRSSISDAGSENHFNTVEIGGERINYEALFQDVDDRSAAIVQSVVETEALTGIGPAERIAIADLFTVQMIRTRIHRSTPAFLARALHESFREMGFDSDLDTLPALPTDTSARLGTIAGFLRREGQRNLLLAKNLLLYRADGEARFITSDHPVTLANPFPYGDATLAAQGVQVHLPIAPHLMLAFQCPTISARLARIEEMDLDDGYRRRALAMHNALQTGSPAPMEADSISAMNALQVSASSSRLFAATDTFDAARALIDRRPSLRKVESHVTIGKVGHGPSPRRAMPPGKYLVVHGHADHCMIPIVAADPNGEGITLATFDVDLLSKVAKDSMLEFVELYDDGSPMHMMREVVVELIGSDTPQWFRVVHHDPAMRKLDVIINT